MCLWAAPARLAAQSAPPLIDYNRQVHAILAARCLVCHSQEKRSGGLSLATYEDVLNGGRSGAVVKPGNSGGSLMLQRITGPPATRMPLGGPALTAAEIGIISSWIDQGARPAPTAPAAKAKWEAPLTLDRPKLPVSPWKNWSAPLDRFTAAYLASRRGVAEPRLASDAVFARRAYLDVWGLLPPPEELRAFLDDQRRRQAVAAGGYAARRQSKVRRELDLVLERPAAQRRRRDLLLRNRRAEEHHRLAAGIARIEHALQPVDREAPESGCSRTIPTAS